MLRNPGSHLGCQLREKETGIVSERVGLALLAANLAVRIEEPEPETEPKMEPTMEPEPAPVVETVSVPPAIAEVMEPAIEAIPELPPISEAKEPEQENAAEQKPAERVPPKPPAPLSAARARVVESRKPKHKES
jgi:hypothetical protein